jgi:hypothetical protein
MLCGVNGWNVKLVILDFFNSCPGLWVRSFCCVCILVATVAVAAVVVVRSAAVSTVVIAVVSIAAVVGAVVVIGSPSRALTFLASSLGPTIGLVVPYLMAVETFDSLLVTLLLTICGKGLVGAVLLA